MSAIYGKGGKEISKKTLEEKFELHSFLRDLTIREIQYFFEILSRPFEFDKSVEIIDYNWQVDKILENAHPYDTTKNRETQVEASRGCVGPDIAYNLKSKFTSE